MAALKSRHSDIEAFLTALNPSGQAYYGAHKEDAFTCGSPTLNVVDAAYGNNAAVQWLMPQLYAVGEYAGVRDKMDEAQTLELARTIRAHYGYLTVTELMLFFSNLKAGRYGKFYGAVDPLVITEAIASSFLAERERWLQKAESERREREQAEQRKNTITYEQFLKLKQSNGED